MTVEPMSAQRRRPGPTRSLTREQIVAAGLELMAQDGLRNVSFPKLGQRLGVDPKALYTYIDDKDDLLTAMSVAVITAIEPTLDDDAHSPIDQLVAMFVALRRTLIANEELIHVRGVSTVRGQELTFIDRIWSRLTMLVPEPAKAAALYISLADLTTGSAINSAKAFESAPRARGVLATIDAKEHSGAHAQASAMLVVDRDAAFEATLRAILDQAIPRKRSR